MPVASPESESFMASKNLDGLTVQLRLDAQDEALQQALLAPWNRLEEAAAVYVEWHAFILWVRAITETAGQAPDVIRSTLDGRCPGFREAQQQTRKERSGQSALDWHALEDWIAVHSFAEPKARGWFDAVMYYAYKNLRTEQAWTLWERSKAAWSRLPPPCWPTLEEWNAEVVATRALSQPGTARARAVEALANVNPDRLHRAVSDFLEGRAFAFWVDCASVPQRPLNQAVWGEIRRRCPGLVTTSSPPNWDSSLFFRLVRSLDSHWRAAARAEGWYAALRYHVVYHPRYHRLIHYRERCHDERRHVASNPPSSFSEWLSAADAYFVRPES
jgi:hypothetical protein